TLSGFLLTQMLLGLGWASAGTVVAAATNSAAAVQMMNLRMGLLRDHIAHAHCWCTAMLCLRDSGNLARALSFNSHPRFQNLETEVAVDHVDSHAVIEGDVVALRRRPPRNRLRNVKADLARVLRIDNVNDPQPAAEPDGMDDAARHALAELMRAEARAAHPAERRIELADLELRQRLDGGEIADVEGQEAGMGAPASRLLLACA